MTEKSSGHGLTRAGDSQFIQNLLPKPKSERQKELMRSSLDELTAIFESGSNQGPPMFDPAVVAHSAIR